MSYRLASSPDGHTIQLNLWPAVWRWLYCKNTMQTFGSSFNRKKNIKAQTLWWHINILMSNPQLSFCVLVLIYPRLLLCVVQNIAVCSRNYFLYACRRFLIAFPGACVASPAGFCLRASHGSSAKEYTNFSLFFFEVPASFQPNKVQASPPCFSLV